MSNETSRVSDKRLEQLANAYHLGHSKCDEFCNVCVLTRIASELQEARKHRRWCNSTTAFAGYEVVLVHRHTTANTSLPVEAAPRVSVNTPPLTGVP